MLLQFWIFVIVFALFLLIMKSFSGGLLDLLMSGSDSDDDDVEK